MVAVAAGAAAAERESKNDAAGAEAAEDTPHVKKKAKGKTERWSHADVDRIATVGSRADVAVHFCLC